MFVERHRVQTNMTPLCLNSLCVFILPFNLALCPQSSQVYITPSCLDSLCSLAKTLVFAMCPHSLQEYKDNLTQSGLDKCAQYVNTSSVITLHMNHYVNLDSNSFLQL